MRVPFVPRLLARIAEEAGIRIELEPEFEFAGRIIFPDGNTHLFRASNLNINRAGSVAIANDKNYTSYFLKQAGLRVPRELTFFSETLAQNLAPEKRRSARDACQFAEGVGYPVIVKPNDGSLGAFVVKAHRPEDIVSAAGRIFAKHHVALVQEFLSGTLSDIVKSRRRLGSISNLYLSPLATKPQALGFALFYLTECRSTATSILFPVTTRYAKETSHGLQRAWLYTVEDLA